jgi:hypothetical protein
VSLTNFIAFFLVVGLTLPAVGVVPAFVLAAATALATSSLLIAFNRGAPADPRPEESVDIEGPSGHRTGGDLHRHRHR